AKADRARLTQIAEMPAHRGEVRMRVEAQPGSELHGAVDEMLRELERRAQRWRRERHEVHADELREVAPADPLWPDRVLHAQTERVHEEPGHAHVVAAAGARDQDQRDPRGSVRA